MSWKACRRLRARPAVRQRTAVRLHIEPMEGRLPPGNLLALTGGSVLGLSLLATVGGDLAVPATPAGEQPESTVRTGPRSAVSWDNDGTVGPGPNLATRRSAAVGDQNADNLRPGRIGAAALPRDAWAALDPLAASAPALPEDLGAALDPLAGAGAANPHAAARVGAAVEPPQGPWSQEVGAGTAAPQGAAVTPSPAPMAAGPLGFAPAGLVQPAGSLFNPPAALRALPPGSAGSDAQPSPGGGDTSAPPPPFRASDLVSAQWSQDDSYTGWLNESFVAEGRIGDNMPGGTFELDIGPSTAAPADMADYTWTQNVDHRFTLTYDTDTGFATFENGNQTVRFQPTWDDPARDTIFVRTFALIDHSSVEVKDLTLETPDLGNPVPVPKPDGSGGPASVEATGPNDKNSLQISGVDFQDGFTLTGSSVWEYDTGGGMPHQSQLAFQIKVGSWHVDILGDTNRDGTVDRKDEDGKQMWTRDKGAIFNVDYADSDRTGHSNTIDFDDTGKPVNDRKKIVNAADEANITPIVLRKFQNLPDNVDVFLKVPAKQDIQSIHVFKEIDAGEEAIWGSVGDRVEGGTAESLEYEIPHNFLSTTADTTFGIEGLFFRNNHRGTDAAGHPYDTTFNGLVTLTLELRRNNMVLGKGDTIQLKVAPWVMISDAQKSTEVWAAEVAGVNDKLLHNASADAGYKGLDNSGQLHTTPFGLTEDRSHWLQDHVEFGYTQRPGGPKQYEVFRLPYPVQPVQPVWPVQQLLSPDTGLFQLGKDLGPDGGDMTGLRRSGSFGGNLEVLPPTRDYPLGRILMGNTHSDELWDFLRAQEVQAPFDTVPTRWLAVGHVDEVFNFTGTPNRVVVADPDLALQLLRAIPKANRGKSVFFATGAAPVSDTAVAGSTETRLAVNGNYTNTTWRYLRIYDSTDSGSGAAGQVAHIAGGGNGFILIDQVWNTGSRITPATVNTPASTQAQWFTLPRAGDKFVLTEGTKFWYDPNAPAGNGTPAIWTVAEILRDANFRTVNHRAQKQIAAAKEALKAAAGPRGTIHFVKVPVLFTGILTRFETDRTAFAYTPNLANFQDITNQASGNDELYFPRQFSPRDATGADIFEKATRNALANALFAEDWELYHRREGEVHCASITRRELPAFNWWELQP